MAREQNHHKLQGAEEMQAIMLDQLHLEREKELLELEARINANLDRRLTDNPHKHPKAIYFILPNQFGERFCYLSVSPNLNKFFLQIAGMDRFEAKAFKTAFTMLAAFFPLLGAALSDSFFGKWWTIIGFSIVYLIGMIMLTIFAVPNLLGPIGTVSHFLTFLPMLIIALGTGGIKPCVSSHGGDQYLPAQEKAKDRFFSLLYASINVGALVAQFLVPVIADKPCLGQATCYPYAFLIPTIIFALALVTFAMGHRWYRMIPPQGQFLPWKAVKATVTARLQYFNASLEERVAKGHWLNFAEDEYGGVFLDECHDFGLSLALIVLPFSFCQMLYVQVGTEWVTQYYQMSGALFGNTSKVLAAQYANINTIMIIVLVPLFSYVVYPFCERRGWHFPLTYRLALGYFLVIVSFVISAAISQPVEEAFLRAGRDIQKVADYDGTYCEQCMSGWLQFPQWFLLTLGECIYSPTGIQFMYIESGRQFRAISASFWLLTASLGSIWVTVLDPVMVNGGLSTAARNWVYCGIAFVGWILFLVLSWFYVPRKERDSINRSARDAKKIVYGLTRPSSSD